MLVLTGGGGGAAASYPPCDETELVVVEVDKTLECLDELELVVETESRA